MQLVVAMHLEGAEGADAAAVGARVAQAVLEQGATEVGRRRQALEGGAREGGLGGLREGVRRVLGLEDQEREPHAVCEVATLNVDGRMRLVGREVADQWGGGAELEAETSTEWRAVESYMEGKALVVLTDTCMNRAQMKAASARLESAATGAWKCYGTPGRFCLADGRVRGGVLIVWDENSFTRIGAEEVSPGRLVELTVQDRAGDVVAVLGAYMPTRSSAGGVVQGEWELVREVLADRPGSIVVGDLNAELPDALARAGRTRAPYPTRADRWLRTVVEEGQLVSAGPDQATYARGGHESQLDWILADPEVAARLGEGKVEPGISEHDHRALSVGYRPVGETMIGDRRPVKPRLDKLGEASWRKIGGAAVEAVRAAVSKAEREGGGRQLGPAERHGVRQGALLQLVREELATIEQRSEEGRKGAGGKSKYERLREQAGKWEGLRVRLEAAPVTHAWFSGAKRKGGRRIWRVRELKEAALGWGTGAERKGRMLRVATYQAAVAKEAFAKARAAKGGGILEALQEAVSEGGEGGVTAALFGIVNKALRRQAKNKGAGSTLKARAVRSRPQVLLSAVFANDDREAGVVVATARKVLEEVRRLSERTNRAGRSFPDIARQMMRRLRPFPETPARDEGWVETHIGYEAFEEALRKTGANIGVGVDGFPAYILRKMPIQVRKDYHKDLAGIVASGDYPADWKQWVALLAMKPGEDARELGRRRDLWLAPHALKLVTRCLTKEFDRAVHHTAPASNTGFTAGAGATAQTLTLKLHRSRCRREKQDYAVGFCDMGCYFMSICRDVQRCAQEWAGVRPEVTDVMAALQRGIQGRSETAYGLTESYEVERGIMQGCIGSPARSLLQLSFMQTVVRNACQGYRFRREGGGYRWCSTVMMGHS